MSKKHRPTLVSELARLVADYPAEDWRELQDLVRDRSFKKKLESAVDLLVSQVEKRRKGGKSRNRAPDRIPDFLNRLKEQDSEKANTLIVMRKKLIDKKLLPTAATLRAFADRCGIKVELPSKRDQSIGVIIRYLASVEKIELQRILKSDVLGDRDFGEEYDRWVQLILEGR